jgi:alanine racemase
LRWADIDLDAVRLNAARVHAHVPKGTKLFAVVKANGYGHGAVRVARAALNGGAWGLAVSTLEEAHQLEGLVRADRVLVMGGLTPQQASSAASSGFSIGVSSLEFAKALAERDEVVPVHLKIDTGMGRYGCSPEEAPALAKFIDEAASLLLAGTWTHFASADSDEAMTRKQFDRFIQALSEFEVDPGLRHACNSAGAHRFPELALDAVRSGIALYGCEWPGNRPALALRSAVTHLKTLAVGDTVGYGATWRAAVKTPVATIAIGYADGVNRARSNRGYVLVRGHRAPLIGVVSMDAITVDVSDVPGVRVGDVATVIGDDQGDRITAEQVAEWSRTISWEVLTSVGPRVERRYSE